MEIKRGQVWRNKKSGNLVQVVPEPCVLVFTSPKGELVAEHSLVVFEQLYEPVATEDAQIIKPKHPSSVRTKGLAGMLPKVEVEGEERVMEIKAGQIWKRINMDEFFKVVHVSGSDIYLNHLGVRNVSLVTEAVLKDFYTLVCNKGEFIKDKSNMQKTHSTDMVNKGLEVNEAKEMVIKADRLEIDGVDMSKTWVDARVKGMAGAELHQENVSKPDMVNKPPHYRDASGIECIEVTQHMRFCEGNSFKYVYRADSKGNLIEDLKKAAWYAERSWNRNRTGNDRVHWLVKRRGEAIADSRDKEGKPFIAEVMRNIVNNRWWQAYDSLMTEIERLEAGNE